MSRAALSIVRSGTALPPLQLLADVGAWIDTAGLRDGLTALPTPADALLVGLHGPDSDATTAVAQAFALTEAIRVCRDASGLLPRYAVGLFPQSADASTAAVSAAAASLMRYSTSHLLLEDICVNLIAYRDTAIGHQRAADTARALISGLLDTVRGQTLVLTDD